ncbi:MAG: hypothetical protein ACRES7_05020 [Gammaproteobacteria bacterium]
MTTLNTASLEYRLRIATIKILLLLAITLPIFLASARADSFAIPTPQGLQACGPNNPMLKVTKDAAARYGTYDGCFVSGEFVTLQGATHTLTIPRSFASVIRHSPPQGKSFSATDISDMLAKSKSEWRNVDKTWKNGNPSYQKRVNALLNQAPVQGKHSSGMKVLKPILVLIRRLDARAFIVVSVRPRDITVAGSTYHNIKVNGFTLILKGSDLYELQLVREYQASDDIDTVKSGIVAWAHAVESQPGTQ